MLRYFSILFLIFITAFASVSNIYAQEDEDYYDEDEVIIYEEFVLENDSTDRLIDEAVEEKRRKKQEYLKVDSASKTSVEYKEIDKTKWEKYHKDRDYLEQEKEQKEQDFKMPDLGFEGFGFIGQVMKYIVYAVVILGLAFLIFKLFEAQYRQDKTISKNKDFFLEKLEEQIHDVDLDKLLEEYRLQKDFPMMIRIQYLMIIKELSRRKIINWQKQKTNGAYLQEVYGHNLFNPFQKVTRLYERIWFGEVKLNEEIYNEVVLSFEQTLAQIKKINIG